MIFKDYKVLKCVKVKGNLPLTVNKLYFVEKEDNNYYYIRDDLGFLFAIKIKDDKLVKYTILSPVK